jgi:predicted tellurium resistance membrane protein TerC
LTSCSAATARIRIPIIVLAGTVVLKLMNRLPTIVTIGFALLGCRGGAVMFTDVAVPSWIQSDLPHHVAELPGSGISFNIPGVMGTIGVGDPRTLE